MPRIYYNLSPRLSRLPGQNPRAPMLRTYRSLDIRHAINTYKLPLKVCYGSNLISKFKTLFACMIKEILMLCACHVYSRCCCCAHCGTTCCASAGLLNVYHAVARGVAGSAAQLQPRSPVPLLVFAMTTNTNTCTCSP